MDEEFLSAAEIVRLCGGRKHRDAQLEFLRSERIPFKLVRRELLISRHHVRAWLSGESLPRSSGVRLDLVT